MISAAFQRAIDENVRQIKGRVSDGKGYCAAGWLEANGFDLRSYPKTAEFAQWERWLEAQYPIRSNGLRVVSWLNDVKNDVKNWKWKRFKQAALTFEKIIDAKGAEKK